MLLIAPSLLLSRQCAKLLMLLLLLNRLACWQLRLLPCRPAGSGWQDGASGAAAAADAVPQQKAKPSRAYEQRHGESALPASGPRATALRLPADSDRQQRGVVRRWQHRVAAVRQGGEPQQHSPGCVAGPHHRRCAPLVLLQHGSATTGGQQRAACGSQAQTLAQGDSPLYCLALHVHLCKQV